MNERFINKTLIVFLGLLFISGCIVVKKASDDVEIMSYTLSPKPEIQMSEELVRSKKGDMIAFLPKDWFFIDVEDKASNDIISVAVNQDYTLSAVFSNIRINEISKDVLEKEGLLGLARMSFDRHSRKSGGSIVQLGKYSVIKMGNLNYVQYEYSNGTAAPPAKVAVFISNQKECYEYSLVPLSIRNNPYPLQTDIDMIFRSIMTTIQY